MFPPILTVLFGEILAPPILIPVKDCLYRREHPNSYGFKNALEMRCSVQTEFSYIWGFPKSGVPCWGPSFQGILLCWVFGFAVPLSL